jgi:hypothetical protein
VSKKRSPSARKPDGGARSHPASASMPPAGGRRFATYAVVGGAAFIAFCFVYGWTAGGAALVLAPLVAGAFVGICLDGTFSSAIVAGCSGLAAACTSAVFFAMPGFYERATAAPPNTNNDIPTVLYDLAGSLMMRNPLNSVGQPLGAMLLILFGSIGTAGVAWAVSALIAGRGVNAHMLRRAAAAGIVAVVCAGYLYTAISASTDVIAYADREPVAGQYAFDATVYLKTYYNMRGGEDFYKALVDAAAGDARVMKDTATGIRDGKSYGGWLWGPSAIRRPTIFYVWKLLAPTGGAIIYLAALLGAVTLAVMWWGLVPYLSHRAAFVPIFAMPYVLFMTLSFNVFFPDFWAALFVVCALALVMRRQWLAGAAVFLLAAATRETLGPALAVLSASLLVVWLRGDRGRIWLARAGYFAAGTGLWFGFEKIHEALGAKYMAVPYPSSLQVLESTMKTRTLTEKIAGATQYLVFPYGFYLVQGIVTLWLAPLGFWAVLASRKDVRAVVVAYTLFWIAFIYIVGATSSYWGQVIMLPSLVGVGGLLVCADRLDRRLELAEPLA